MTHQPFIGNPEIFPPILVEISDYSKDLIALVKACDSPLHPNQPPFNKFIKRLDSYFRSKIYKGQDHFYIPSGNNDGSSYLFNAQNHTKSLYFLKKLVEHTATDTNYPTKQELLDNLDAQIKKFSEAPSVEFSVFVKQEQDLFQKRNEYLKNPTDYCINQAVQILRDCCPPFKMYLKFQKFVDHIGKKLDDSSVCPRAVGDFVAKLITSERTVFNNAHKLLQISESYANAVHQKFVSSFEEEHCFIMEMDKKERIDTPFHSLKSVTKFEEPVNNGMLIQNRRPHHPNKTI